jgi:hypothetical protein
MLVVYSCDEILERGLLAVGIVDPSTACRDSNLDSFHSHYGSNPIVYAQIWEDLQTTEIEEAKISGAVANTGLDYFLMEIHFLKCYPTEQQQVSRFRVSDRTVREWTWFFLKKVQALKSEKVSLRRCPPFSYHSTHFHLVFACLSSVSDCLAGELDTRKQQSKHSNFSVVGRRHSLPHPGTDAPNFVKESGLLFTQVQPSWIEL